MLRFSKSISLLEFGIFGEGSQILTNHKRENSSFSFLVGLNLGPFPEITAFNNDQ